MEQSMSDKLDILITNKRSSSTSLNRCPSNQTTKLPSISRPLKEPKRSQSSNNENTMKIITSDSLIGPKIDLKSLFSQLNSYEMRSFKLSPTFYLSDFEKNLREECQLKYEKIVKEFNEVRSYTPLFFCSFDYQYTYY